MVLRRDRNGIRRGCILAVVLIALALASPRASARVYTLDECVELALSSNVTLAQARQGVESGRASRLASWSGALPRISGSVGYGDDLSVSHDTETSSDGYTGRVGLTQTIFDGSTFAGISGSGHELSAVEHSFEATRRAIVLDAKRRYYGLLKTRQLRDVQKESLELTREQLRKTQSLFDLGSASKSDLLKAQVQVGQAELGLISAEKSAESARAELCYVLGIDILTDIEPVDPVEGEGEEEILTFDLAEALARRPDVMAKEEKVLAARRSLLSAKAARWPDLGLSVTYSRSQDSLGDLFDDPTDEYKRQVGLSLSVPIFSGLATKASIDGGKAALRSEELSLRDTRLAAARDIEVARLSVLEQKRSVAVAETAVQQAEEDLRISEERYRLRAASMLERIDARVAYSSARASLVEARYNYEITKAELANALGL